MTPEIAHALSYVQFLQQMTEPGTDADRALQTLAGLAEENEQLRVDLKLKDKVLNAVGQAYHEAVVAALATPPPARPEVPVTDERQRALEWVVGERCKPDGPGWESRHAVFATIEAALRAPRLSDEQWERIAGVGDPYYADIATAIRAAREPRG